MGAGRYHLGDTAHRLFLILALSSGAEEDRVRPPTFSFFKQNMLWLSVQYMGGNRERRILGNNHLFYTLQDLFGADLSICFALAGVWVAHSLYGRRPGAERS